MPSNTENPSKITIRLIDTSKLSSSALVGANRLIRLSWLLSQVSDSCQKFEQLDTIQSNLTHCFKRTVFHSHVVLFIFN